MATVTRSELIDLLERLGARQDEEVLNAGRKLHRTVSDAGLAWTDLLRPGLEFDGEAPAPANDDEPAVPVEDPPVARAPAATGDDAKVLDSLLASKAISSDLRKELKDLKRDLAEGDFTAMDRDYIRALADRLGIRIGK